MYLGHHLQSETKRLTAAIERFRERVDALNQFANAPVAREMLDELLLSIQALQVAEEELRIQNEALDSTYRSIEDETQRYRDLFDHAPLGYIVTDLNGTIQEANLAASQLLQVSAKHLQHKPLTVYIAAGERREFRSRLNTLRISNALQAWETQIEPRKDETRTVAIAGVRSAIHDRRRPADIGIRWIIYDLTEHKRLEAAEREREFSATFEQASVGMALISPNGDWLRVNSKLCDIFGYPPSALKQRTLYDLTFEDDQEMSRQTHQRLVSRETDSLTIEKRYIRSDGRLVWARVSAANVINTQNELIYIMSVIEDITEQKRIETMEREQRTLAAALQDTSLKLTSSLHQQDIFNVIHENIKRVIPHDAGLVAMIEDGVATVHDLWGYADAGMDALGQALTDHRWNLTRHDLIRRLVTERDTVRIGNWADLQEWEGLPYIKEVRAVLGAPIIAQDDVIGVLILHSRVPDLFREQHANILRTFAAQAAVALQNAHLYEEARKVAILEERQRIARDLHDAISQNLFSSSILCESLPKTIERSPDAARETAEQVRTLNRSALAEMRVLLWELRPEQFTRVPLPELINQLTEAARGRKSLQFELNLGAISEIPSDTKIALFRIVQEALNNIIKHAQAQCVGVRLWQDGGDLCLRISDNGVGFDSSDVRPGIGLESMRERAEMIGAHLKIDSAPNQGVKISVRCRLAPEARSTD